MYTNTDADNTDFYKLTMAEAGYPLAPETFYLSFRKPGPYYIPFDMEHVIKDLRPKGRESISAGVSHGSLLPPPEKLPSLLQTALQGKLEIHAPPKGSWVVGREPIATISGPSFLVSWLEPLLLQLHYPIQVATLAKTDYAKLAQAVKVVHEEQHQIILKTLDGMGIPPPPMRVVDSREYIPNVESRVQAILDALGDDSQNKGKRIFEVGLRSAVSAAHHIDVMVACGNKGVSKTSNVAGGGWWGMIPVGTMGHEHVQRFGSDKAAFEAMLYRLPPDRPVSFLLDTFSTLRSGIPAAFKLIAENPERNLSVRFDSGNKAAQLRYAVHYARELGIDPTYILEDGFNANLTREFEGIRKELGLKPEKVLYGYGGYLVSPEWDTLTRDNVSAVYKLSETRGRAVMKLGDETMTPDDRVGLAGKSSLPGRPVAFKKRGDVHGPHTILGQLDEIPPKGYVSGIEFPDTEPPINNSIGLSTHTQWLINNPGMIRVGGAYERG